MNVSNTLCILITIILYPVATEKGPCANNWNGCCPNTQWDSGNETCIECPIGYYWLNCSRTCVYPHFGPKCAFHCSCEETHCNFMIGCTIGNEPNITSPVFSENPLDGNDGFTKQSVLKGIDYNLTQPVSDAETIGRKQHWLITSLILVTTILAVVSLAYFVLQTVEKCMKREVTA